MTWLRTRIMVNHRWHEILMWLTTGLCVWYLLLLRYHLQWAYWYFHCISSTVLSYHEVRCCLGCILCCGPYYVVLLPSHKDHHMSSSGCCCRLTCNERQLYVVINTSSVDWTPLLLLRPGKCRLYVGAVTLVIFCFLSLRKAQIIVLDLKPSKK